jgi:hypothetical protein
MERRATVTLSTVLALIVLALPLRAGAERSARRDSALGKAIKKHIK